MSKSRTLASIAYAPAPPEGQGYAYPHSKDPDTPFRPHLLIYPGDPTVIVPDPENPPTYDPTALPPQYRPDPKYLPPLVPLPEPEPEPEVPQTWEDDRTGDWMLTQISPNGVTYYRLTRGEDFEFLSRSGKVYARSRTPELDAEPLPGVSYLDPPPDGRRTHPTDVPLPGQAHVYVTPDCPARVFEREFTVRRTDLGMSRHGRYGVILAEDLPSFYLFLTRYGKTVTFHPGEDYNLPETYQELRP